MLRCGVDFVEIDRIKQAFRRRPHHFMKKFFTENESLHLAGRKFAAKHLAVRFAGKEAVFKLLGQGLGGLAWTDVEIINLPGGEPTVRLCGQARQKADALGINHIAISLSHGKDYAVAFAVATANDSPDNSR